MQKQQNFLNDFCASREYWMKKALGEARIAFSAGEIPVGCVIVRNHELIASAHNLCETFNDPIMHAEIIAIRQACNALHTQRLIDCTLYVTLEPCPMCAGAIMSAQLKACCYALADNRQGCCGSVYALPQDPSFYHHVYCFGNILAEESANLLHTFFKDKRGREV